MLASLAAEAIKTLDVPVSTIILYNGSVIGKGYNTVNKYKHIGGHAEINAISNAIQNIGESTFKLIKDSVILVTSFEPCLMCKGAIIENG